MSDAIAYLTSENERLRCEVVQLRQMLMPRIVVPAEWKLYPQRRRALTALLALPMVSRSDLEWYIWGSVGAEVPASADNQINVILFHVRRVLVRLGARIEGRNGEGWRLPPEQRRRLREICLDRGEAHR